MTDQFEPGVYVKGDKVRSVQSRAAAVQAVFDGFKRQGDSAPVKVDAPTPNIAPEPLTLAPWSIPVDEAPESPTANENSETQK